MKKEESFNYFCGHLTVIMKAKYLLFIFLATTAFYLSSCQKEISYEIGTSQNFIDSVSTGDSIYLSKLYDLYDAGSGVDTQEVITIHYDALRRATSLIDSLVMPGATNFHSYNYYYNNTDSIPFKLIDIDNGSSLTPDTVITYFNYNLTGQKIKDSILRSLHSAGLDTRSVVVTNYSYAAGFIFGYTVRQDIVPGPSQTITKDTATLDNQGNIVLSKKYKFNGLSFDLNITSTFAYDNHPNPFSRLSLLKAHQNFPNGETLFLEYISSNNRTSQSEITVSPAYNFQTTLNYSYSTHTGLPVQCLSMFGSGPDQLLFRYKSLP
jgi:hypothetical protein